MTRIFTIGFTQKSAKQFFSLLQAADVRRVVDTRLNNRSQLAGFSKADDLPFFLRVIGGIDYVHDIRMAPTQEMLDNFKKLKGDWLIYEAEFGDLLRRRNLAATIAIDDFDRSCLLCSEHEPTHCHRRLVAEYLQAHFPDVRVEHLM